MNEVLLGRSGVAVERRTEMEVCFPRKLLKIMQLCKHGHSLVTICSPCV